MQVTQHNPIAKPLENQIHIRIGQRQGQMGTNLSTGRFGFSAGRIRQASGFKIGRRTNIQIFDEVLFPIPSVNQANCG